MILNPLVLFIQNLMNYYELLWQNIHYLVNLYLINIKILMFLYKYTKCLLFLNVFHCLEKERLIIKFMIEKYIATLRRIE